MADALNLVRHRIRCLLGASLALAVLMLFAACQKVAAPVPAAVDAAIAAAPRARDAGAVAATLAQAVALTQPFVLQCYANVPNLTLGHIEVHVVVDPRGEIKFAELPRKYGISWLSACVERAVMTAHLAVDLAGPQTLEYDLPHEPANPHPD